VLGYFAMGISPRDRGCVSMCAPTLERILFFRGMPRQRFLELNGLVLGECYAKALRELCRRIAFRVRSQAWKFAGSARGVARRDGQA
jgi:hypothetical protein